MPQPQHNSRTALFGQTPRLPWPETWLLRNGTPSFPITVCLPMLLCIATMHASPAPAAPNFITRQLHHLRWGPRPEWTEFALEQDSETLEIRFESDSNQAPWCLRVRQQDVKQTWRLLINDRVIGQLKVNENDMVVYFEIPAGTVQDGTNVLRVEQDLARRKVADDIRVGELTLFQKTRREVLGEAQVSVTVVGREGVHLPCRLTITNEAGALQSVDFVPDRTLAVRPGVVYTANGEARIRLPAGKYTVNAGRGFEYSWDRRQLQLNSGDVVNLQLELRREVPTEGYAACDTHVHSLTHSGHGDATVEERMVTLAGEGIELPIATDHNVHIDHRAFARAVGVDRHFTPVIGNEVTTAIGHFNVFPIQEQARVPNHRLTDYGSILDEIYQTPGVKVAILNHARDLHGGTRPFGPKLHNAVVGENREGWPLRFNAMEVVNSGATQTDPLQLFRDWMGLLNRGRHVTPVGSSDSHDVARHFVGQGRTYIRCDDRTPSQIGIDEATENFLAGRVLVSYGLLAELIVEDKYRSGETVPVSGPAIRCRVRVLGPHWVNADRVLLFANGQLISDEQVPDPHSRTAPGVIWQREWMMSSPSHDTHLVAVALGPGIRDLAWPTAKPYQPTSPAWTPRVIGCSGAIWLDVDGDGRPTPAYDYAQQLINATPQDPRSIVDALSNYDAAVAAQVAHQLQIRGAKLLDPTWQSTLRSAASATRTGFRDYLTAWRQQ